VSQIYKFNKNIIKNLIFSKSRIKIGFIILVSFLLVKSLANTVFVAETPRINQEFIAKLKDSPQIIARLPGNLIAGINGLFISKHGSLAHNDDIWMVTPAPNAIFRTISKGVSAAEDPITGQHILSVQAGVKYRVLGTVVINGVEYPKIEFVE